jgi:hypothetical protein
MKSLYTRVVARLNRLTQPNQRTLSEMKLQQHSKIRHLLLGTIQPITHATGMYIHLCTWFAIQPGSDVVVQCSVEEPTANTSMSCHQRSNGDPAQGQDVALSKSGFTDWLGWCWWSLTSLTASWHPFPSKLEGCWRWLFPNNLGVGYHLGVSSLKPFLFISSIIV